MDIRIEKYGIVFQATIIIVKLELEKLIYYLNLKVMRTIHWCNQ